MALPFRCCWSKTRKTTPLIVHELRAAATTRLGAGADPEEMRRRSPEPWDLVIADYSLPHFSAPEALTLLRRASIDVPFIIVSGAVGEETAVRL